MVGSEVLVIGNKVLVGGSKVFVVGSKVLVVGNKFSWEATGTRGRQQVLVGGNRCS